MGCTESSNQTAKGNTTTNKKVTPEQLKFSEADMAAFKNTFNSADDNGDRKLNKDEFFDLIKKSGEKKTDNQIECLWYSLEQDDKSRIDFDSFMSLLDGTWDDKGFADNLAANIFDDYDKDRSGFLNLLEFKSLCAKLEAITGKEKSTRIEMEAKFREVDANDNGKLSKAEVIKAINGMNN